VKWYSRANGKTIDGVVKEFDPNSNRYKIMDDDKLNYFVPADNDTLRLMKVEKEEKENKNQLNKS